MPEYHNPLEAAGEPTKKELVIFFVIDTSSSMTGVKINTVNTAIREFIPELRGVGSSDAKLKAAVLCFSSGSQWLTVPVPVEDFTWNDVPADGWTDLGSACLELNEKMSRKAFLNSTSGYASPIVIIMSDGQPNSDWENSFGKLSSNSWFKLAIKIAIAIGNDADIDVLAKFTGNREAVFVTHTPADLRRLIKIVTVTSSQLGSNSLPIDIAAPAADRNAAMQQNVAASIKSQLDSDGGDFWDIGDIGVPLADEDYGEFF
jgi:uncharacterized protein YegL